MAISPQKLQNAINWAEKNPQAPAAVELKKRIEEGRYNNELSQLGVETSKFQPQPKRPEGIVEDFTGDVSETVGGLKSDIETRADKIGEINQAQQSGEQGFLRSAFQKFGQGVGAASDVIGRTVVGAGKALLPQSAEEAIGGAVEKGVGAVVETDPVQNLLQKFETIKETDPALARDIDSALGIGLLTTDLATAGLGGQAVRTGARGINKGIDVAEQGVGAVTKGGARVAEEGVGVLTGTSQETLEQAFMSSFKGGKDATKFKEALRGQTTPEELVDNVRTSLETVRSNNSRRYKESLTPIVDETVDTSNITQSLKNKFNEFNISVKEKGELDFSQSKFRTVPQAQTKIQQTYNEAVGLGDNATIGQVDTTRQALNELKLVGDDNSARSANALIEEAIGSVRNSGKQVDGYERLLSEFGENAEFLEEITRSLASGDKQTIDTAYRRLATSLKTNNERRRNLIRELDEVTGNSILSDVSGQQLSELMPRGIIRQIGSSMALGGIATGGVSSSLLVPLVFASPRVMGEFVNALGLSARKAKVLKDVFDSARKTLNDLNVSIPVASPASEGFENNEQEIQ